MPKKKRGLGTTLRAVGRGIVATPQFLGAQMKIARLKSKIANRKQQVSTIRDFHAGRKVKTGAARGARLAGKVR